MSQNISLGCIVYTEKNRAYARLKLKSRAETWCAPEIAGQMARTILELHKSIEAENKVNKLKLMAEVLQSW